MLGFASAIERAGVVLVAVAAVGACGGATDGGEAGRGGGGEAPTGQEPAVHRAWGIEVTDPVITEPLAGGAGALYLSLVNHRGAPTRLTGLAVQGADASLHRTEEREGRSAMRPVEGIDLSPGDAVRLRPGGFHGMIRWSGGAPVAGDTVAVGLRFEGRPLVTVPAKVVGHAEALERHPPGGP